MKLRIVCSALLVIAAGCGTSTSQSPGGNPGGGNQITATANASVTSGMAPLAVSFTGQATGGTGSFTYDWSYGDGSPHGSGASASHTFATAGSFNVVLTAKDAAGNLGTAHVLVTAGSATAPTVSAQADHTTGLAPLAVNFTATATGGTAPVALAWAFGDGQTGTGASVSHTYAGPGNYSATVTATDAANKTATSTVMITIGSAQKPAVGINANPTSGASPLAVQFNAVVAGGTAPLTYAWDFGDSQTDTTASPMHTYAAGTYTAKVTVTDAAQNTATANVTVVSGSGTSGGGGGGGGTGNTLQVTNFNYYFSGPQDRYEPNDNVAYYLGDFGSGNATYNFSDAYIDHRDVTYYADIVNYGPAITTPFYVDFYANSSTEPSSTTYGDQYQTISNMDANSTQRVYFTITQPTPGSATTSWIRADSTNAVTSAGKMNDSTGLGVTPTADVDWFAVYETANETITVDLTNLPADYDLEMYDASGNLVGSSTNSGTTAEHISYTTTANGNYFIKVFGFQAAYDSSNPYTLNVVVP